MRKIGQLICRWRQAPKNIDTSKLRYLHAGTDVAYHGSPFNFRNFDVSKIGSGEGCGKRGRGIYLFRSKRFAPFFANIRCADAPPHIGATKKLADADPRIYTVNGLNDLNLRQVTQMEAKAIARNQAEFEQANAYLDGIELPNGEICIFPKAVERLRISNKQTIDDFVLQNKDVEFREWTTDKNRLRALGIG